MYKGIVRVVVVMLAFIVTSAVFLNKALAQDQGLLFGQQHRYSVLFRGNGEAIVYARLVIYNTTGTPMDKVSFEVPGKNVYEMLAFQQVLPRPCMRYGYAWDSALKANVQRCDEYQEPDYTQEYYGHSGQAIYKKIKPDQARNTFTLALTGAIQPGSSGAVVLSYAAQGYVNKDFGLYNFNFPTLKVDSRVQLARVAVDVDTDLVLKGKKSKIDYNTVSLSEGFAAAEKSSDAPSTAMDSVVRHIGYSAAYVKEAKSLAPGESLFVRGSYAASSLPLYYGAIGKTVIVVAIVIAALYFFRRWRKAHPRPVPTLLATTHTTTHNGSITILDPYYASMGLLSATGVMLLSFLVSKAEMFTRYPYNPNPILVLVGFIVIVLMYALAVFGPAAFAASRHGWKAFLSIMVTELLWLFLFLVLYGFYYHSGLRDAIPNQIPLYQNSGNAPLVK